MIPFITDRERFTAQREVNEQVTWKQKYKDLAKMVNKMYMKLTLVSQMGHAQTIAGTEETMNRLQWLERHFTEKARQGEGTVQGEENLQVELESVKETLKREMAISKGLRRTIEKLQEEIKGLGKTTEHEKVDGMEMKTVNEQSRIVQSDVLELREKVHELEKENESLQHKLKKKDKELERFHSLETGKICLELFRFVFFLDYFLALFLHRISTLLTRQFLLQTIKTQTILEHPCIPYDWGGGGGGGRGAPLCGQHGDVPLDRVWCLASLS